MIAPVSGPIDLTGKVAIVTGASRGIGRAICLALAREGANVGLCDILPNPETSRKIRSMGQEVLEVQCDIRRKASILSAVNQIVDSFGRIDILVNNAGILGDSSKQFEEYSEDEWDLLLQTNLRGVFLMTQAVWPYLKKQGSGKVICVGSIAGRIGGLLAGPHYCASKGGIHAFVKWAAKKGSTLGIYVNGIAPGPIKTPMTTNEPYKDTMVPLGRLGEPEDIAEVAVFLASQASNFIAGNIIDVNGGILMV
jgi:3-oxoacyl-[acyl-carrier protein] reductase